MCTICIIYREPCYRLNKAYTRWHFVIDTDRVCADVLAVYLLCDHIIIMTYLRCIQDEKKSRTCLQDNTGCSPI